MCFCVSLFVAPLPYDPYTFSQKLKTRRILHDLFTVVHLIRPHPPPFPPCPHRPHSRMHTGASDRNPTRHSVPTSARLTYLSVHENRDDILPVPTLLAHACTQVHRISQPNPKASYQAFFRVLIDLIVELFGLIIKPFDNQTES